jgi:hypothetical protein
MFENIEDIWDNTWRDDRGKVVIWQTPNRWLIGWAVLTFISLLVSGKLADVVSWVASAALITWAFLEITKGANYFRRALGALVLIYAIATLIKSL